MAELVAEKDHAVLGPSGWHTWSNCPGSVPLSEGIVDKGSTYAREGTAAHSLLELCLTDGFNAEELIGKSYTVEGETFTVDMEMATAVNDAIGFISTLIDPARGDVLMPEQRVPIGHLTGETDAEGTSDIVGITREGKCLVIGDFKYGKGVVVWASEFAEAASVNDASPERRPNGQLAMYALGTLEKYGLLYDEIETIMLVVLQPRCDHYDSFELSVEELRAFGEEVTLAAGRVELEKRNAIEGVELMLVPGDKQCKFCKAKAICPALRGMVSSEMKAVSGSDPIEFEDLTLPKKAASVVIGEETDVERLMSFFRAAPLMEEAIKAVRAEVERRLFAGDKLPGVKLVEGKKGNRRWVDGVDIGKELTKSGRLPAADAYDKVPISPTTAEKRLKDRPKVWAKIAPLITQPPGKPSVAKEDDPRPEYLIASAVEEFEDLSVAPALDVDDLMA